MEYGFNVSSEQMLQEVKEFADRPNVIPTWVDYEHFKSKFIAAGYYGYESRIARLLRL